MSREEAIETLKLLKPNMRFDDSGWLYTQQALEMAIQSLSQEPTDTWSIKDVADTFKKHGLIREQEPCDESGMCKNCKYFEYDSVAKVDGIPLIVAHEICNKWGGGCKTKENGYCYLFEPQESEK